MIDISQIKRPALLVKAASLGIPHYDRKKHLRRCLPPHECTEVPKGDALLLRLKEREQEMEDLRNANPARHSIEEHLHVLIALMSEASIEHVKGENDG